MVGAKPLYDWLPIILIDNMPTRNRSKRKYGFGDHTAPTKLECLELVEKEKEVGSSRLAELMKIDLNHASRLLSDAGAKRQAEMTSGLIIFAMAIEAFHRQDLHRANNLIQEAKEKLPAEFVNFVLKGEINVQWQPLRYALQMLESFNTYLRKFQAEKGYSFESRVRELFRNMRIISPSNLNKHFFQCLMNLTFQIMLYFSRKTTGLSQLGWV